MVLDLGAWSGLSGVRVGTVLSTEGGSEYGRWRDYWVEVKKWEMGDGLSQE